MRMRKKKHGAERLDACRDIIIDSDSTLSAERIRDIFGDERELWLEIGAGKGGFACEMAKQNPSIAYIALEKVFDCVVLAAEGAKKCFDGKVCNLRFMIENADNLARIIPFGSVSRIYLNFSDPWTKKGYAKRRLTHARYLSLYMNLLKDGGVLQFKTDNTALFDFSLDEIKSLNLSPSAVSRDLHSSEYAKDNVMTEYEKNFSSKGVKINMLSLVKPCGFTPDICEELKLGRRSYKKDNSGITE